MDSLQKNTNRRNCQEVTVRVSGPTLPPTGGPAICLLHEHCPPTPELHESRSRGQASGLSSELFEARQRKSMVTLCLLRPDPTAWGKLNQNGSAFEGEFFTEAAQLCVYSCARRRVIVVLSGYTLMPPFPTVKPRHSLIWRISSMQHRRKRVGVVHCACCLCFYLL